MSRYFNIKHLKWTTSDMLVAVLAGIAIGTTIGLLLAFILLPLNPYG